MNAEEILALDRQFCWHPFTQAQTASNPLPVVQAKEEFLISADGSRYFDAASSWWVNLHGHSHPTIANAIGKQAHSLEHVMFAGVTHPPAVKLAQRLIEKAPENLQRVFYSDNGSTAVEVALKMAFQYWDNKGQARRQIIALEGAYHGDTFGAMSTGRSSGFYDPFIPWLFDVKFIPTGLCPLTESESLSALDHLLERHHHKIAALIIEPLVQGASGMRMMSASYVAALTKRCAQHNVLVIFDEVMTGFGRTGTFFAAEQVQEHGGMADLICLSKGLTGGAMPMGATLATESIYEAFLDDRVERALLHGHSYTANPLGCAAALASLDLFDNGSAWRGIKLIQSIHQERIAQLIDHPQIKNPRQCGTIAAFELKSESNQYGSAGSQWIRQQFFENRIVVRPLGLSVYWIPPYCTSAETLNNAYDVLEMILEKWTKASVNKQGSELF